MKIDFNSAESKKDFDHAYKMIGIHLGYMKYGRKDVKEGLGYWLMQAYVSCADAGQLHKLMKGSDD